MVRALDGDSTMTSLVPWPLPAVALAFDPLGALVPPLLLALAAPAGLPALLFAVSVLAGTLFPSSHPRRDRHTVPVVIRRLSAATTGPVRCVPLGSPD